MSSPSARDRSWAKSLPLCSFWPCRSNKATSLASAGRRIGRALDFWQGLKTGMGDCSTWPKAGPDSSSTTTFSPLA
jgi:hypothetical protein